MNPTSIDWTAVAVFVFFFLLVTVLGFVASRWKAGDLSLLHEWGLGGRRFGTVITWFLIGGDFYTAYTVIAVPALVYSVGAYGFFALPYTIIVYPLVFLIMPRLWGICRANHHVTVADFVHVRYGSKSLALAVAITGIIATMPYIALQLIGMQVVIAGLGFGGTPFPGANQLISQLPWFDTMIRDLPLIIAFLILAFYTYTSGLRAPAMIAFVKDVMIYIVVIAAVTIIPLHLGGYGALFRAAQLALDAKGGAAGLTLKPNQMLPFATLAFGSALAAFMYPHTLPTQYAIDLQLLGGVWILQTFPAIVFGLFLTRLRAPGLLAGWAVGMILGTWMAEAMQLKPVFPFQVGGQTYAIYIGVIALIANLVVSFLISLITKQPEAKT